MLKDILRFINRDGYISRAMLARELNVSEEMIDEGISQLVRMGYILEEETGEGCSTFCIKCPFAKSCNKGVVKTFQMSDKGKRCLD